MEINCPPLLFKRTVVGVSEGIIRARDLEAFYGELVEVLEDRPMYGRVIGYKDGIYLIEVAGDTYGLSETTGIRRTLQPPMVRLSPFMFGRFWNAFMEPADGGPPIMGGEERSINHRAVNPLHREEPHEPLITGFSAIDIFTTLVKGQKLALMFSPGLDSISFIGRLLYQVIRHNKNTAVVLGLIEADKDEIERMDRYISSVKDKSVIFVHQKGESSAAALLVPRLVMTTAQHLWLDKGLDVLVVIHDMARYGEALREVSNMRGEIAIRKGYPAYLFSDFASIFEGCGVLKDRPGSLTLLPSLTIPGDDLEHPIPDTVGYITEGQILFRRTVHDRGIDPPIDIINSLSRMMHHSVEKDHLQLAMSLYQIYNRGWWLRETMELMGQEIGEGHVIKLVNDIEKRLIRQRKPRPLNRSLQIAQDIWRRYHVH